MNLGERIYQLRTKKKLSQNDLAELLNVSRQSISKWENNNAMPDLEKAVKLSEILEVTLDELVKGGEISEEESLVGDTLTKGSCLQGEEQLTRQQEYKSGTPLCKIAGMIFVCMALFIGVIMLLGTGSVLNMIILMSPFLLCGIACLKAERHLGLWCGWAIYFSVDMYLRYGTVCDWTQLFYHGASVGSTRWFIALSQFLGMIGMILWSGLSLRKPHSSRQEDLGKICGLSWGIFVLALIFVEIGNRLINQLWDEMLNLLHYLWGRYFFGLLDWVRIAAFTLAVVSTVRYFSANRKQEV